MEKRHRASAIALIGGFAALSVLLSAARGGRGDGFGGTARPLPGSFQEKTVVIVVPGNSAWTDTGLDVASGAAIAFEAEGKISLQKGNPEAECGPDGYDLQTNRQPVPEKNLGALIGKVVIAITVIVDEKTKQEKKLETAELFFIGSKNSLEMPAKGRLYLGINEDVIGDNDGVFRVTISAPPAAPRD